MNRFLRWKTPWVEPIEYTRPVYNNGSLPPRILTFAGSVWLKPGKMPIIRPGLYIQGDGKNWYLVRDGYKHNVLINGQPYIGKHLLQDGDFVQWKNGKFIYQSDPVADNRLDNEPYRNKQTLPHKYGSGEGLSLNKKPGKSAK